MISVPSEPSDFDKNRSNPCYSKRPSITACPLRLSGGGGAGGGNSSSLLESWGVVPGGAGSAMAPPDFGRLFKPISIRGGRLCQLNNTGTLEFSDLPTTLSYE